MSHSPLVEKQAVLDFLTKQATTKARVAISAEEELESIALGTATGDEGYMAAILKLTAAKAFKLAFEKVAEHVNSLEEF